MPGAKAPLNQAEAQLAPWAIVTSGTTGLVTGWLKVLGLPKPKHMVLAEDALMGRQSLGLEAKDKDVLCLRGYPCWYHSWEGGRLACKVMGVVSSTYCRADQTTRAGLDSERLEQSGCCWNGEGDKVVLEFRNDLVENELANELELRIFYVCA
ncbi:hypothetical protein BDFG_07098 [Blastomyces dermatitidis ATCC 26199]|nr:hypothetical protein BDFG_07098 [Blastomyces dermatitidis ATCC 26199]